VVEEGEEVGLAAAELGIKLKTAEVSVLIPESRRTTSAAKASRLRVR
jgi:hypothetical protein